MKKICKSALELFFLLTMALLSACTTIAEDDDYILLPDNGLRFTAFPNDAAKNDSISANLSHGIKMIVHPKATYELSFDADLSIPKAPSLQLFKTFPSTKDPNYFSVVKLKNVSAVLEEGRYVYRFSCEGNSKALWALTLEQNETYYQGTTNNFRLTGEGAYSDHMSLNLVVVGNVASQLKKFTIDDLAEELLTAFRKNYGSITIDTIYVRYSSDHPTLGSKYPADEPWIAGWSSEDKLLSELGGWPGIENALDMVLVHSIVDQGVLGYSNLFSGNMGGGTGSTVILGANVYTASGMSSLDKKEIVETAIHETGHFFGLRHTTSTNSDMKGWGDFSVVEDGFDDTPYCEKLLASNLLKTRAGYDIMDWGMPRHKVSANFNLNVCEDATNIMFPIDAEAENPTFSEQQLATLRASLMIYPH